VNEKAGDFARFLFALIPVSLVLWVYWAAGRRRQHGPALVEDEPSGAAYRVFTRDHDQRVRGRDLAALMGGATSDRARGWATIDDMAWQAQVAAAQTIASEMPAVAAARQLADIVRRHPHDWALTLLIDMSGSMRGDPIIHVAAHVRWLCNTLHAADVPVALLGFSTMGWHGGAAKFEWEAVGSPERPGRLCALLSMDFKSFDAPLQDADWSAMLHPDALRENVDGEALEWAADSLLHRPERKKLLLVLSDGAPVDDATLANNGSSYLERHLLTMIESILQDGAILLGAIGVGYAVDRYYPTAFAVDDFDHLSTAMVDMIDQLLSIDQRSSKDLH
jgi:cobaltochelatase CobT